MVCSDWIETDLLETKKFTGMTTPIGVYVPKNKNVLDYEANGYVLPNVFFF